MEPTISNQPTVIDIDLPFDRKFTFSDDKEIYKKRIEKKQIKLLKKIPYLRNFLDHDERIFLVTTGCSPTSVLEQLLTGWIFIYLKRSLFVFTNKRIFHIPTKKDFSYRYSIATIQYTDCRSIRMKGSKLVVDYKNGSSETFLYIRRSERKKLKILLTTVSLEGSPGKSPKRTYRCPRCTNELQPDKYVCSKCGLEFKRKDEANKIAIIFPGGGYFYTRHPWLGMGDAFVETALMIGVIFSLVDFINHVTDSGIALFIFSIFLIIEKAISVFHSNHFIKEYIPKEKDVKSFS